LVYKSNHVVKDISNGYIVDIILNQSIVIYQGTFHSSTNVDIGQIPGILLLFSQ